MSSPTGLPTPIPLGSPHVAKPPTFARWRFGLHQGGREEKRDYSRRSIQCNLWMIDGESQAVLRCKISDISDAGLHASAAIGFGLAIGQRYELRIANGGAGGMSSPHLATPLGYGTVVRSGIEVDEGEADRVGFAVRFDVPQLIPV